MAAGRTSGSESGYRADYSRQAARVDRRTAKHVRNADVLVIEATFLDRDSEMARDYGHLTAAKAAALALESNVKQLVLNHISGRYPEEEILAEAAMIFPDSRVAADFDRFVV
jgi:ribonuclease Z